MAIKYVDINNVRTEEMLKKWQKIMDDNVDPFDPLYRDRYIGGVITVETEHWYAFQNDHPYEGVNQQFVMTTKRFFADSYDLPDDVWLDLLVIQKKLRGKYGITGGGFIMRFGDTSLSGATVVHQHAQIIVPEEGSTVAAWFGSKKK